MISVIIPTYKNKGLLLANIKHNIAFLSGCQIIIANDNPLESLKKDLSAFPNIELIENGKNLGFGINVNNAVKSARGEYLLLLNSDVKLIDDSYRKAVSSFAHDDSLFAVSFLQKEKNSEDVGKNYLYWQKGFVRHKKAADLAPGSNGWAECGSCLIDKKKFLELGGFDPLYSPFYWEDIDLSYRAKKKRFTILFEPSICVIHEHESTIGKYFKNDFVREISFRNQLIFIWKNVTYGKFLLENLCNLPKTIFAGGWPFLRGFIAALGFLPRILRERRSNPAFIQDKELLVQI